MQNSNFVFQIQYFNIQYFKSCKNCNSQVYLKLASLSFVGNLIEQREMGQFQLDSVALCIISHRCT